MGCYLLAFCVGYTMETSISVGYTMKVLHHGNYGIAFVPPVANHTLCLVGGG